MLSTPLFPPYSPIFSLFLTFCAPVRQFPFSYGPHAALHLLNSPDCPPHPNSYGNTTAFVQYNGNNGYILNKSGLDDEQRCWWTVAQAFSHFTHHQTGGEALVGHSRRSRDQQTHPRRLRHARLHNIKELSIGRACMHAQRHRTWSAGFSLVAGVLHTLIVQGVLFFFLPSSSISGCTNASLSFRRHCCTVRGGKVASRFTKACAMCTVTPHSV